MLTAKFRIISYQLLARCIVAKEDQLSVLVSRERDGSLKITFEYLNSFF